MAIFLRAVSYYLPSQILSNEDLNMDFPEWSVDKISLKTGIYQRHISASDETVADMGVKAAEKLFEENNINKNSIDFLLFCTQNPDYKLPTTACLVQERLGLSTHIGALDYNLGCSGYVYGLALAKGLIMSGAAQNVLLITAEAYTKYIHHKDKSNRTIFGDGASASLISQEDGWAEINDFVFGTDGSGAEQLILRNGGIKHRCLDGENIYEEDGSFVRSDNFIYMNGKGIFNFTASIVPALVEETLKKNDLSMNDISLYVFHQANKYMLNFIRKKIGIPEGDFFIHIKDCGNTVSSTIPIAIYHAHKENRLKGNVLLAGFGVGLSWASGIIKA